MNSGLLLLRIVIGLTVVAHGAQKLTALEHAAKAFEGLGFVPGRRNALFAGVTEVGGGLAMALGLATPAAVAVVVAVMLVAGAVHVKNGFFLQNGGYEYTLVLGLTGLSVAFTGPGRYSLDACLAPNLAGVEWGLIALALGLVGGGLQLATRRPATAPHKA
jgi:putative oxidoreductase